MEMSDLITYVKEQENLFTPVISDKSIKWDRESQFCIQAIQGNDYLANIAEKNIVSFQNAIINVAAIGISLNPASKHAYLVPRDGRVCLDISYMGLLHIATSDGSILWGQAKIVYSNDTYENQGLTKEPIHKYNAFGDRGEPIGCYCTAKLPNGDFMTEEMDRETIHGIRERSKGFASGKQSPWKTDELEMWRKTVVKRANKYWPNSPRLDKAVQVLNDDGEGVVSSESVDITPIEFEKVDQLTKAITDAGRTVEQFCQWATQMFKREINCVTELYESEFEKSYNMVISV